MTFSEPTPRSLTRRARPIRAVAVRRRAVRGVLRHHRPTQEPSAAVPASGMVRSPRCAGQPVRSSASSDPASTICSTACATIRSCRGRIAHVSNATTPIWRRSTDGRASRCTRRCTRAGGSESPRRSPMARRASSPPGRRSARPGSAVSRAPPARTGEWVEAMTASSPTHRRRPRIEIPTWKMRPPTDRDGRHMTIWFDFTTTLRNSSRNGIADVEWNLGVALLAADERRCARFALDERRGLVRDRPGRRSSASVLRLADGQAADDGADPEPRRHGATTFRWRSSPPSAGSPIPSRRFLVGVLARCTRRVRARLRTSAIRRRLPPTGTHGRATSSSQMTWSSRWAPTGAESCGRDWLDLKRRTGLSRGHDGVRPDPSHAHAPRLSQRSRIVQPPTTHDLSVSDLIWCISEQSRQDLPTFVRATDVGRCPRRRCSGSGEAFPTAPSRPSARGDFYLVVGTVERRKNLELLYDALRIIESEARMLPVVVVAGAIGWGVDDLLAEIRPAVDRCEPCDRAARLGRRRHARRVCTGVHGRCCSPPTTRVGACRCARLPCAGARSQPVTRPPCAKRSPATRERCCCRSTTQGRGRTTWPPTDHRGPADSASVVTHGRAATLR